ncbi:MAG: MerR family transcriptional regulator [Bacteroidia bacterium]
MGIDLKKLHEFQEKIENEAYEEMIQNISENLIDFVLDNDIIQDYRTEKGRVIAQQSKRVIGHWVKEGIILGEQNIEGGWYYFNKTESIWIDVVTQLREFGLSLPKIKLVRNQLFNEEVPNFRIIDFALMHTILREAYVMLVYPDGVISLTTLKLYSNSIKTGVLKSHIVFNFKNLIYNTFPDAELDFLPTENNTLNLTPNEMKLLYYLRTKEYKEIRVRAKEGEVYLIEAEKEYNISEKIIDIIRNSSYQDITIKVADNKIVNIKTVEKEKTKK